MSKMHSISPTGTGLTAIGVPGSCESRRKLSFKENSLVRNGWEPRKVHSGSEGITGLDTRLSAVGCYL